MFTFYDDEPGYRDRKRVATMRERAAKAAQYLGPWCPDCGKKGERCKNRETCRLRAIKSVKTASFVALPRPTDEWMAARGYGTLTDRYHAGGRWKQGGKLRLVHYLSPAQIKEAHQHYAYELEMGRAEVAKAAA